MCQDYTKSKMGRFLRDSVQAATAVYIFTCVVCIHTRFIELWQPYKSGLDKHALIHTSETLQVNGVKPHNRRHLVWSWELCLPRCCSFHWEESTQRLMLSCRVQITSACSICQKKLHRSFWCPLRAKAVAVICSNCFSCSIMLLRSLRWSTPDICSWQCSYGLVLNSTQWRAGLFSSSYNR